MIRTSVRLVALAAALVLVTAAPASAARGFSHGVTAGDVTASSAILWAHSDRSGRVTLQVARDRRFKKGLRTFRLRARGADDNTVQRKVGRLAAGRTHHYRFLRGRSRSDVGTFRTAPAPRANATVQFAWTGDTDFQRAAGQTTPFWNSGQIFRRIRAERNHFNIHLGDTIYSDTEVPPPSPEQPFPVALSVEAKWGKYKQNLDNANLRSLRRAAGFYSHWDDHEFINDFSQRENTFANAISGISETIDGPTLYRRGVKAFTDYSPVTYSRANGIYRSVRWGRNLELFFLDERSFRDAKADEGGVCDNPETGEPDLAPTGPQDKRDLFSVIAPSLKQPVSPACLAKIRDPNRDFLGDSQFRRFTRAIDRSKARFKVIMNELPIQQYYALPYDRWEGYEAERQRLLTFLQKNVKNVIFLTTDVHATLVNDARFQTLEPGGPKNSGIWDYTVGPAATANFGLEIDQVTAAGAGAALQAAFLEPEPPAGVGMRCSVVDKYAYGQVKVTARALTVTSKGIDGRPLSGCKPLVLRYER